MAKCIRCGKKGIGLKVGATGLCFECLEAEAEKQRGEIRELGSRCEKLEKMCTPEMAEAQNLKDELFRLREETGNLRGERHSLEEKLRSLRSQIIVAGDTIEMETFSLYTPTYAFASSEEYKHRLDSVRVRQKEMIKRGDAVIANYNMTYNNDARLGKKMVEDMVKLFLRSFNSECDTAVSSVKFSNFDRCKARIEKSFEAINKLGTVHKIQLSSTYLSLKIEELRLAFEYAQKKQAEKEEQAEIRRREREQAKLEKEIAEARKVAEKEQRHYEQALESINSQILSCSDGEKKAELEKRKAEIMEGLDGVAAKLEDIDYRQTNQRAGYVYIISNIGAFGENVYKIGMTRRLNPMDRVDELGDASVPFYFDVHAMIFSADAPALEAALHRAFEGKRLNMVNRRREYFRVTLDEIKKVVRENHDKTVEFVDVPPAEQYRESLLMKR